MVFRRLPAGFSFIVLLPASLSVLSCAGSVGELPVPDSVSELTADAASALDGAMGPDGSGAADLPLGPDVCVPDCQAKECGDDGCGGQCGKCPKAAPLCVEGKCEVLCVPDCEGKECGSDGCEGDCGKCPKAAPFCVDGTCALDCTPDCQGKECGDDGCGGSCGTCSGINGSCHDGTCQCLPDCTEQECGDDGCGGKCGNCPQEAPYCDGGTCVSGCVPDCTAKECGDDGCGGKCGDCKPFGPQYQCKQDQCVCTPICLPDACVLDGCGGFCEGPCGCGEKCVEGICEDVACAGKECGSDGCGGTCGQCAVGKSCSSQGKCVCAGVQCGNACCQVGQVCNPGTLTCCQPSCTGKLPCTGDGCGGLCPPPGGSKCCDEDSDCSDNDVCTQDQCAFGLCYYTPSTLPGCCVPFTWSSTFDEGTNSGFSFSWNGGGGPFPGMEAKWQVTNVCGAHSSPNAAYYGMAETGSLLPQCTYSLPMFPVTALATATTPLITLPKGKVTLTFWAKFDIGAPATGELVTLEMVPQSGPLATIWDNGDLPVPVGASWQKVTVDLTAYAGKTVQIRWIYSCSNVTQSGLSGIFLDDILVSGGC